MPGVGNGGVVDFAPWIGAWPSWIARLGLLGAFHAHNVEQTDEDIGEALHHHPVNIWPQMIAGRAVDKIIRQDCEVQKVEDEETQDDDARNDHRS